MNKSRNLDINQINKELAELEFSALKLSIDGINVWVTKWIFLSSNQSQIEYICFHKDAYTFDFDLKVQQALTKLLKDQLKDQEIQENNKWYKILFSKIYVLIKNIREKFGLS